MAGGRQRTGLKTGASGPISERTGLHPRRKPAGATRFWSRSPGRALPLFHTATVRVRGEQRRSRPAIPLRGRMAEKAGDRPSPWWRGLSRSTVRSSLIRPPLQSSGIQCGDFGTALLLSTPPTRACSIEHPWPVTSLISRDYLEIAKTYAQAVAEIRSLNGWLLAEGCSAVALMRISLGAYLSGLSGGSFQMHDAVADGADGRFGAVMHLEFGEQRL